jgi:hypothetical protein
MVETWVQFSTISANVNENFSFLELDLLCELFCAKHESYVWYT